jgi:hypothetical protein
MDKIGFAKKAVSLIVGVGVGKIVGAIVKNNVSPSNPVDTVAVTAGAFVLGAMVADWTEDYTNAKIDKIVSWWKENVTTRFAQ